MTTDMVGTKFEVETDVNAQNVASAVGSGLVDVFATPMMIAQMELAASRCLTPFLKEGQASVGTHINASHSAATPVGGKVRTQAVVTAVDRRRVEFEVVAWDDAGEVGRGTHTRFVVDVAEFRQKAAARASK